MDNPAAEKLDFSCLENIYNGGEAMEQEKKDAVDAVIKQGNGKVSLLCGFGMTELTSVATICYLHCNYKGGSGIPIVRLNCSIVNVVTNEELTYGEQGEVCFSGDTLMLGYYQNEATTNEMIKVHSDGNRWASYRRYWLYHRRWCALYHWTYEETNHYEGHARHGNKDIPRQSGKCHCRLRGSKGKLCCRKSG